MEHWFDSLTRRLADAEPSRRTMLGWSLRAGLGAAGAALLGRFGRGTADASAAANPVVSTVSLAPDGACNLCEEGQTSTLSLTTRSTFNGKPISLEQTAGQVWRQDGSEVTRVIQFDGEELLRMSAVKRGEVVRVRIDYGKAFKGVKSARFEFVGKAATGEFAKRKLAPFNFGDDPNNVKFADGKPAPEVTFAAEVPEAIKHIFEKALQDAGRCPPPRVPQASARRRAPAEPQVSFVSASFAAPARGRAHPASPSNAPAAPQGEPGHRSSSKTSWACVKCQGECIGLGIKCSLGGAAAIFVCPPCGAALIAYCLYEQVSCMDTCHDPGHACCPIGCGEKACCDGGEICLDIKHGLCCSAGTTACGARRCCGPTDACIPATGVCCPAGQLICGNACCPPGHVCKDSVCCPPANVVCGGVCCGAGDNCINNQCCRQHQSCGQICCGGVTTCADPTIGLCCFAGVGCNGKCCGSGQQCVNGECCNPCGNDCCTGGRVCCGGVCCPAGQTCKNAATQTCSGCPPGQTGCIPDVVPGASPVPGICCPPGVVCCHLGDGQDKCCPPGEFCCSGSSFSFDCRPPGGCIAD